MGIKKLYKKGFTLVEMVVVIGVISLALPALFSIIFTMLQQQTKIYRLSQVKREGDFALSSIENVIRNYGIGIYNSSALTTEQCSTKGSSYANSNFYIKDKNGAWLLYSVSNNQLSSSSAVLAQLVNLTTSKLIVSNLTFSCYRGEDYPSPIVFLSFDIAYNSGTSTRPEDLASMHYQTKLKLREY